LGAQVSLLAEARKALIHLRKAISAGAKAFFSNMAKGFENFFLIERHRFIPERFEEEYNRETAILIEARIKLACSLGIAVAILLWIFGYLFFLYLELRHVIIPILVSGAAIFIIILNRSARQLREFRLLGYLLSFTLTLAVSGCYLISPQSSMMGVSGFLLALLVSSFMFPWTFRQTYLICFINLVLYVVVSSIIGRMLNPSFFFFDFMLLAVASIIACAIKRSDDLGRQREFVLNKELAEKTELIEKDLRLARSLHQSLLPRPLNNENIEVAVDYLPMHHIGGDFARVYQPDGNSLTVFICDITGHGVSSALLVNRIHREIETLIKEHPAPGALLGELDSFVKQSFTDYPMFLSAFCGLLDLEREKIVYANYGHPPQLLMSRKENKIYQMKAGTTVIGVEPETRKVTFFEKKLEFTRGDFLVLYTDGILEARGADGELFGLDRLVTFALSNQNDSVQAFNQALIDRILEYRVGEASDDILLLTIQTKPRD
jgi:serine phosphatase RsbU (regulator of sigma subunit)